MKYCSRCGESKEDEFYNYKNKALGIRDSACKDCTRKSIKEHYYKNHDYYLDKVCIRNRLVRSINKNFLHVYLLADPCVDCGESDPIVLEFDHFGNKTNSVARLARTSTMKSLLREIDKCVVRCANGHRRKTAKQFNWSK